MINAEGSLSLEKIELIDEIATLISRINPLNDVVCIKRGCLSRLPLRPS